MVKTSTCLARRGMHWGPTSREGSGTMPSWKGAHRDFTAYDNAYCPDTQATTNPTTMTFRSSVHVDVTLASGWQSHGDDHRAYGHPTVSVSRGVCVVEGIVERDSGDFGAVITTLPVNCRPGKRLVFAVTSNDQAVRVDVAVGGAVSFVGNGQRTGWVSLSGVTFVRAFLGEETTFARLDSGNLAWYDSYSPKTYAGAAAFCATKGGRLATLSEYCPGGTVFGGRKADGDKWAPYSGAAYNTWVQVGTYSGHAECKQTERQSWGTSPAHDYAFKKYVLCARGASQYALAAGSAITSSSQCAQEASMQHFRWDGERRWGPAPCGCLWDETDDVPEDPEVHWNDCRCGDDCDTYPPNRVDRALHVHIALLRVIKATASAPLHDSTSAASTIDGNDANGGAYSPAHCVHTKIGPDTAGGAAWIRLDLGRAMVVHRLQLVGRSNCCPGQSRSEATHALKCQNAA